MQPCWNVICTITISYKISSKAILFKLPNEVCVQTKPVGDNKEVNKIYSCCVLLTSPCLKKKKCLKKPRRIQSGLKWILRHGSFDAPWSEWTTSVTTSRGNCKLNWIELRDIGLMCLLKKRKIHFRILSDLRIQSWIFLKKRTPNVKSA